MKAEEPRYLPEKKYSLSFGVFSLSFFLHLAALIPLGSMVILYGHVPKTSFQGSILEESRPLDIEIPETPETEDAAVLPEAANTAEQPDPSINSKSDTKLTEVSLIPENLIVSQAPSLGALVIPSGAMLSSSNTIRAGAGSREGQGSGKGLSTQTLFGSRKSTGNALTGYMYDLKQTKKGDPSDVHGPGEYQTRIREFVDKGWDMSILNRYYKVSTPLNATQFFIPAIAAEAAPKAFDAEKDIQPRQWLAYYKGNISPSSNITLRFVGFGDDILLVRINNCVVLDGSIDPVSKEGEKRVFFGPGISGEGYSRLYAGNDWLKMEKGCTYSMEVLIGEKPGGMFSSFLLFEEKGKKYKMRKDFPESPSLPVFQTTPTEFPPSGAGPKTIDAQEPSSSLTFDQVPS